MKKKTKKKIAFVISGVTMVVVAVALVWIAWYLSRTVTIGALVVLLILAAGPTFSEGTRLLFRKPK